MFRKTIVAVAATAAIAVAALPSTASAHKWHGGWGYGVGIGLGVGLAATALYATSVAPVCRTIVETRYSFKRGVYYQVPVTYC